MNNKFKKLSTKNITMLVLLVLIFAILLAYERHNALQNRREYERFNAVHSWVVDFEYVNSIRVNFIASNHEYVLHKHYENFDAIKSSLNPFSHATRVEHVIHNAFHIDTVINANVLDPVARVHYYIDETELFYVTISLVPQNTPRGVYIWFLFEGDEARVVIDSRFGWFGQFPSNIVDFKSLLSTAPEQLD